MSDQQIADLIFNIRKLNDEVRNGSVLLATAFIVGQLNCPVEYAAKTVKEIWQEIHK